MTINQPKEEKMGKENKPEMTIRAGTVRAAIWKNSSDKGDEYFTVSLSRGYKDGDDWKETNTYNRDDLMKAKVVLDKAVEFLFLDISPEIEQGSFRGRLEKERETNEKAR